MYEEPASVVDIPDLAIALVDYDDHGATGLAKMGWGWQAGTLVIWADC